MIKLKYLKILALMGLVIFSLRVFNKFVILRGMEQELFIYSNYDEESTIFKILYIPPKSLFSISKEVLSNGSRYEIVDCGYNGKRVVLLNDKKRNSIVPVFPYVDEEVAIQKQKFNDGEINDLTPDSSLTFVNLFAFNIWLSQIDSCDFESATSTFVKLSKSNDGFLIDDTTNLLKVSQYLTDSIVKDVGESLSLATSNKNVFYFDERNGLYKYKFDFDQDKCFINNLSFDLIPL